MCSGPENKTPRIFVRAALVTHGACSYLAVFQKMSSRGRQTNRRHVRTHLNEKVAYRQTAGRLHVTTKRCSRGQRRAKSCSSVKREEKPVGGRLQK